MVRFCSFAFVFVAFVTLTISDPELQAQSAGSAKRGTPPAAVPVKPVKVKIEALIRFKSDVQLLDDSFLMPNTVIGDDLTVTGAYTFVDGVQIDLPPQVFSDGNYRLRTAMYFPKGTTLPAETEPALGSEIMIGDDVVLPKPLLRFGTSLIEPGTAASPERITEEVLIQRARAAKVARTADTAAGLASTLKKDVEGIPETLRLEREKTQQAVDVAVNKALTDPNGEVQKTLKANAGILSAAQQARIDAEGEVTKAKAQVDLAKAETRASEKAKNDAAAEVTKAQAEVTEAKRQVNLATAKAEAAQQSAQTAESAKAEVIRLAGEVKTALTNISASETRASDAAARAETAAKKLLPACYLGWTCNWGPKTTHVHNGVTYNYTFDAEYTEKQKDGHFWYKRQD